MSHGLVSRLKSCAKDCTMLGDEVDAAFFNEAALALTEARAEIERLRANVTRLTANPADHRYWEGRWRDADRELSTLRARVREVVGLGLDVISEERGWGTYPRMEGSEIYTDADVFSRAARQLNEDLKDA